MDITQDHSKDAALLAEDVRVRFGDVAALDGLSLHVRPGTVFGLLGPNGAGKTTLVRVFATLLRPASGRARVLGHDVVADPLSARRLIGLAGQFAAVDNELTGRENVEMIGRLYRLSPAQARQRAGEVLERFGLADVADRRVTTYSGGMRRRLDLGASLVGRPPVVLLDEPSTGLDPRSRQELWDAVDELRRAGTTVLLTTQYLEEADQLADRISLVDRGRVVADGTADELKARTGGDRIDVVLRDGGQLGAAVALLPLDAAGVSVDPDRRLLSAPVTDRMAALSGVVRALEAAGIEAEDVVLRRPTLDEVFLHLTGDDHRVKEAV